MSKAKTSYVCNHCGAVYPQWHGKCPACSEWNTLGEFREAATPPAAARRAPARAAVPVAEVEVAAQPRRPTHLEELDRVLGGGLVPGALMLLAGDPGLGKSTLLLQAANAFAEREQPCLYVSGEESLQQVALRSRRLGSLSSRLLLLAETDTEVIEEQIQHLSPGLVVIDSIQSMYSPGAESLPGSVSQVREGASRMMRLAKDLSIPTFLVGHVTKDGNIAGPRLLEHMVDTVLSLEGEHHSGYRVLRAVKNRFGSTDELGLFRMVAEGMVGVPDASAALLEERRVGLPGSSVVATLEGNRPLLVEIQALVSEGAPFGAARRSVNGLDYNRTCLIIAVCEKRARLPLAKEDVFINLPGGIRVSEPATDLGLAMAIASSVRDEPIPPDLAFLGEVGLTGEVRSVPGLERRLGELARHGFQRCLVPPRAGVKPPAGLVLIAAEHLHRALEHTFGR
jgi:DNA repair protein RadA/Sms